MRVALVLAVGLNAARHLATAGAAREHALLDGVGHAQERMLEEDNTQRRVAGRRRQRHTALARATRELGPNVLHRIRADGRLHDTRGSSNGEKLFAEDEPGRDGAADSVVEAQVKHGLQRLGRKALGACEAGMTSHLRRPEGAVHKDLARQRQTSGHERAVANRRRAAHHLQWVRQHTLRQRCPLHSPPPPPPHPRHLHPPPPPSSRARWPPAAR